MFEFNYIKSTTLHTSLSEVHSCPHQPTKNITFPSMLMENAVLNKAKHPRKICLFCYFSSFPFRNIIINKEVTFPIACRNLCAFITVHNCVHLEPFPFAVEPTWYDPSRPSSSVPSCGTNTRQVLFSRDL